MTEAGAAGTVAARFAAGDRVRTRTGDPAHHTRLPRYARGCVGVVLEPIGVHPLPDDRARGRVTTPQPVYTVRFRAAELFGEGAHEVTLDIWEAHLEPAG